MFPILPVGEDWLFVEVVAIDPLGKFVCIGIIRRAEVFVIRESRTPSCFWVSIPEKLSGFESRWPFFSDPCSPMRERRAVTCGTESARGALPYSKPNVRSFPSFWPALKIRK